MGNIFCTPKADNYRSNNNEISQNKNNTPIIQMKLKNDALSRMTESANTGKGTPFPKMGMQRSRSETNATAGVIQKDINYQTKGILKKSSDIIPINKNYQSYSDESNEVQTIPIEEPIVDRKAFFRNIIQKRLNKSHLHMNNLRAKMMPAYKYLLEKYPEFKEAFLENRNNKEEQLKIMEHLSDQVLSNAPENTHEHTHAFTFKECLIDLKKEKCKYTKLYEKYKEYNL